MCMGHESSSPCDWKARSYTIGQGQGLWSVLASESSACGRDNAVGRLVNDIHNEDLKAIILDIAPTTLAPRYLFYSQ